MTSFISNLAARAACDAVVDRIDLGSGTATGLLRIYAGSVPADADAALGGATLLAELTMSNPAFGAAADGNPNGVATASAITQDSSANATGTATFYRIVDRDGTTIHQGAVTATGGGGELQMNTTSIVSGAAVAVSSFTFAIPE